MTIASLRTLVAQIPNWQSRLDKLVAEIAQRQNGLSSIENGHQHQSATPTPEPDTQASATNSTTPGPHLVDTMNIDSATSADSQQPTTHSIGNGLVAKKTKPEPVYFDGSMQKFFEELVHFIAVSRNMMRKAKMSARIAQIKKMAEVEISDEFGDGTSERPTLRYVSARRLDSLGPPATTGTKPGRGPDIFDALDKNLDNLQATCELAAFQFLREASDNKHMKSVKKLLGDVLNSASSELARLARDEPDMIQDADAAASRTKRPLSMRKELPAGAKPTEAPNKRQNTGQLSPSTSLPSIGHMEVDLTALQNDEHMAPQVIHMPANVRV
ncbi:hypothetical protein LMH87_006920 [Akanthomyces muscarius]|uniref:Uncharacterized protein n=1 Tax=Akanthomyces muscarius TaxID=2231603 RepID=A0A9W8QRV6_AKAMU|nr:hypothetical protein LMH87_006920 [Akanthomyces muscarius]KAJ4165282.1 hypothetical protein LMH87_006920 [Akanthomyces muscarius]